jgi:hypothetical protein
MRSSTHLKQYPMASDLAPVRITSRPHGRLFFCLSNPGYRPEHGITPCALHIGTPKKETMNNLPSDDELDSIVAKTAPAPTTTTTPTPAQAEAISEWNADDEDGGSDVLRASGLPYVKVKEGMPVRLALVPGSRIVGAAVHFCKEDNRYYLCASTKTKRSECCVKLPDAKGRAAALCFTYKNQDPTTAKIAPGVLPIVEVSILTLSRSNWTDFQGSVEEGASIFDYDFRLSVADKVLARKVAVIARAARWKEIGPEALALATPFIADNSQLKRALGRKFEAPTSMDAQLADIENL